MTARARDAMTLALLLATALLLARAALPAPSLGPPHPAEPCPIPVELAGRGVRCLDSATATRLGAQAGDRVDSFDHPADRTRMAPARLATLEAPVDPNRASLDELASLPGVGPSLAARIAERRPYRSTDDLLRVPGIGAKRLSQIAPRIRIPPR
jgi:predicted flap endonuclease-1-like 5' DNA nuclease